MELSVDQKHTVVRAEQGPLALSRMFELGEVWDVRKLILCLLFLTSCFSVCVPCSQIPHLHTSPPQTHGQCFIVSKQEFTEEHRPFMIHANYVTVLHTELFRLLDRDIKDPYSAVCADL